MAILTTGNTYSDGNQITSTNLNAIVNSATFDDPIDTASGLNLTSDTPPKIAINTSLSNKTLTGGTLNNCPIGAATPSTGAFTTLTASGDVNFDSNTLFVDASTNNVGIGSSAPDKLLVVAGAGSEIVIDDTDATDTPRLRFRESGSTSGSVSTDAGELIFDSGTTERMRIDSSGNVGVGTNNPSYLLDVSPTNNGGEIARFKSDTTNAAADVLIVDQDDSNIRAALQVQGNAGSTECLFVGSNGNVGIGTTSPNSTLHLSSSGPTILTIEADTDDAVETDNARIVFKQDGGAVVGRVGYANNTNSLEIINEYPENLFLGTNNGSDLTIYSDGNVGIGTTSPSEKLHVKSSNSDTAETVAGFGNGDIDVGLQIKTNGNGGSSLDWGFNAVNSRNLVFDTNQNERMRITSTGNVGIGDNDPSKELVVKQISSAGSESIINIIAGNAGVAGVYFGDSDDDIVGGIVYDNSADTLQLRSSDNHTAVTINSSEQVGIGTSPSHKLDVNSGATNQVALFESTDATAYIELADNTGSAQLVTPANGDLRFYTGGSGAGNLGTSGLSIDQSQNVGIGDDTPSYKLDVNGTGRFVGQLTLDDEVLHNISGTQTRLPGYYAGTYGAEIEQTAQGSTVHIGRSNGNCVNIGADAPASPTQLAVVYFRDTSTGIGSSPQVSNPVGNISITDSTIHFNSTSDYRLKENEVDITDGIDRLKQLKPYRFNFTRNPSKVVDGFFAHEVSPVVPESISGEKDQVDGDGNPVYQGIDQSKLVPLLTAALQEAVAKIEALEARVQTLEG